MPDELSVKKPMQETTAGAAVPFSPKGAPRIKSRSAKQQPRRLEHIRACASRRRRQDDEEAMNLTSDS
jgi:hypothetical protein